MKIDRTKNARNGIAVGMVLRVYQTVVPFLMRTAMIHFMGVEYSGLNSLFSSVLHILNLAELGVGAAMVFSMYKPIAQDDTRRICALMHLYRRYYRLIGLVILAGGLLLTPFIPKLINGDIPHELNVYYLYWLNLGATVLTYWLFAYRNCLLQAHQRIDTTGMITLISSTIQYLLQFIVLVFLKDYYLYVIVMLLSAIVNNCITALVTKKMYPQYRPVEALDMSEISVINGKIRDIFFGKLGSVVVNHADTVVISSFLGLSMLAIYQNYYFIMSSVFAVIEMILASIMAGLGNSFVTESLDKIKADLMKISFLYLWLIGVCCCCFIGLYQPFMEIWMGKELMLGFGVVICLVMYFCVYTFTRLLSIYKDAAGLWHEDRFRPLISAGVNLMLNLLTVRVWGIYGVVLSTVVSMGVISIPWILHILFSRVFNRAALAEFLRQVLLFAAMTVMAGVFVYLICMLIPFDSWMRLFACMMVCVIVPNILYFGFMRRSKQFQSSLWVLDKMTNDRFRLQQRMSKDFF